MNWMRECVVVIPCCNEVANITGLVQAVRAQGLTVIVIDDGSRDHTASVAAQAGAQIIRHDFNQGKGAALRSGLTSALAQGFIWAFTMDGDGQHSPLDIPVFLRHAQETNAELVVGNRMHSAHSIPWVRRWVNQWMSRLLSRLAGRCLPDSQCGFRLIHLPAWRTLILKTEHFEIESEMLLAFLRAGFRIEFVPIQVIGKSLHSSHIRPLQDTCRWLWWWWQAHQPRP